MKLLLHTCCGTCLIYPHSHLAQEFKVISFYYNPNIQPRSEHEQRRDSLRQYCQSKGIELISETYALSDYFDQVDFRKGFPSRCHQCYQLRLNKTAARAKEENISLISTTLLVSPYQQHDQVRETGEKAAAGFGLEFVYQDFRQGFRETRMLSKSFGIYQQKYCGCIFSEDESSPRRKS